MAILIKTDGTQEVVNIPKADALKFMQEKVGGYIQIVPVRKKGYEGLIVDEEGKLKNKPVNMLATAIYNNPNDTIVGDAILFKKGEVE